MIVAILTVVIFGGVLSAGGETFIIEPAPTDFEELSADDELPGGFDVAASTGNAVAINGSGSYVDEPSSAAVFDNSSWTVALVAQPATDGFNEQSHYSLYAKDNGTVHLLYEDGYWTARYEDNGQTAYVEGQANLTETSIAAEYDNSVDELRLYVDGSQVDSDTPDNTVVSRGAAVSWNGNIDEVRVWSAAIGAETVEKYADDPIQPLATSDAEARLMFNQGNEGTVYYVDGTAEFVNDVELTDGVTPPDLEEGVSYEVQVNPVEVRIIEGGYLDDAPVAIASWDDNSIAATDPITGSVVFAVFALFIIGSFVVALSELKAKFVGI